MPTLEQVELAETVLDFITKHQANWNQGTYLSPGWLFDDFYVEDSVRADLMAKPSPRKAIKCGTAACFAGWLAIIDHQPLTSDGEVRLPNGDVQSLGAWGVDRLDLPDWDGEASANHLFADHNEMAALERHVANLRSRYEATA